MGKPERFYGNSFCFLAHMAGRQSENKAGCLTKTTARRAAGVQSGSEEGPEAPRPSAHTDSGWTARLPTARLPFCGGKKKSPYRFNGLRGFLRKGANKTDAFTRASQIFVDHMEEYLCPTQRQISAFFWFALRRVSHGVCAITSTVQHQHGQTAATAEVEAHTGS